MEIEGRTFELVIASDVHTRDGLGVELEELVEGERHTVAEVFRSDEDSTVMFSAYERNLPLAAVQFLIRRAEERLTPHVDAV
jgi:hypothetical protein